MCVFINTDGTFYGVLKSEPVFRPSSSSLQQLVTSRYESQVNMEVFGNASHASDSGSSPKTLELARETINHLKWQHIVASVAVYFISVAFYRLYLHPLAKFPGPKIAALTRWYEGYYDLVLGGQYTFRIADMHEKYGKWLSTLLPLSSVSNPNRDELVYRSHSPH
jgi:hypothetical protein